MTTLEDLERLLKAGTPWPWETWEREARSNCWEIGTPEDHVADLFYCREEDHAYIPWDEARASSNAALIVAAINALPGLLESARRVEEMRAALQDAHTWHESADKAISKQPNANQGTNGWNRLQHQEQMELISNVLKGT